VKSCTNPLSNNRDLLKPYSEFCWFYAIFLPDDEPFCTRPLPRHGHAILLAVAVADLPRPIAAPLLVCQSARPFPLARLKRAARRRGQSARRDLPASHRSDPLSAATPLSCPLLWTSAAYLSLHCSPRRHPRTRYLSVPLQITSVSF
jgi:hypothetical protein